MTDNQTALRWADMAGELAGVGYWWMDTATRRLRWSPNMYRIFGLAPEKAPPTLDFAMQFVHPDDRGRADSNLEQNLAGGTGSPSLTRIVRPSGEIRHIEGRNACEFGPKGEVLAIYGTVLDITDRRTAELAIAASEQRFRFLAENATDIIACYRPDGVFTFLSPAVEMVLGYAPGDLVGRKTFEFIHAQDHESVREAFRAYIAQGSEAAPVKIEYRAIRKDGAEVWLEAHPRGIYHPETGALVEIQDVVRDVTQRKRLERDIIAAKEAAEAAADVKAKFLSNISHELRTPLTAIIGYSSLLNETADLPPLARRHIDRVESASRILSAMVNGLLDFSRLEAGRVDIRTSPVSPGLLARECLSLVSLPASEKGLRLEYVEEEDLPALLEIDPDACRQVLVNLIGNAVKFTDQGFVRVSASYDAALGVLHLAVEDSGPGIAASDMDKLFRRFSQIDGRSTRGRGGAGLGLAICKGLVEAMGGWINAQSVAGEGSVFSFTAPALIAASPHLAPAVNTVLPAGARVLVADQTCAVRDLARNVLETTGADVTEAATGPRVLELAQQSAFDLVLLDCAMPEIDGRPVVHWLRSRRGPNRNAPIVAITAADHAPEHEALAASGFDAIARKPIVARELLQLIADLSPSPGQEAP